MSFLAARTERNKLRLPALSRKTVFRETDIVPDLNVNRNPSGFLKKLTG